MRWRKATSADVQAVAQADLHYIGPARLRGQEARAVKGVTADQKITTIARVLKSRSN